VYRYGAGNYPASVFITFHMMFAAITTALITGAFAERMKVTAVWAFAVGWSTIVYCPLAHQVWGGDGAFLHSLGGATGAVQAVNPVI
jgi:Amt family ammonium transporter